MIAANLISFSLGGRKTKIICWTYLTVGLLSVGLGVYHHALVPLLAGLFLTVFVFVVSPLSRSLKRSQEIWIKPDADGIVAETGDTKTLYKWSTITRTSLFQARLFVMISDGCSLVIPERATDRANLYVIIAEIERQRIT